MIRALVLPTLAAALHGCGGPVVVTEVLRGDLVVLSDGTRLRYAGVEAPGPDDPLFDLSREANRELVMNRALQRLPSEEAPGQDADEAAFVLAPVEHEGRKVFLFVQGELTRFGYTRTTTPPDQPERADLYSELQAHEAEARELRRGMWSREPDEGGSR